MSVGVVPPAKFRDWLTPEQRCSWCHELVQLLMARDDQLQSILWVLHQSPLSTAVLDAYWDKVYDSTVSLATRLSL